MDLAPSENNLQRIINSNILPIVLYFFLHRRLDPWTPLLLLGASSVAPSIFSCADCKGSQFQRGSRMTGFKLTLELAIPLLLLLMKYDETNEILLRLPPN